MDRIALRLRITPREIATRLQALADLHGLVLHLHATEPWVVHPFSTTPTPHYVEGANTDGGRLVSGALWALRNSQAVTCECIRGLVRNTASGKSGTREASQRRFLRSSAARMAAVMLTDELNFTRAAERLKITQPALSKQIVQLEKRLGFSVFVRGQRRVELTDAGQVFIRGCRDAHAVLERAIRLAKVTNDEVQPLVTIGHSPYADPSLVAALLSVVLPLFPNLRLRIESMFATELAHAVFVI